MDREPGHKVPVSQNLIRSCVPTMQRQAQGARPATWPFLTEPQRTTAGSKSKLPVA